MSDIENSDLGNKVILANNLKYYMTINKVERNDLCKNLGFKYTTLTDWINAKKYPRIEKIEMMANYFGIQKSDLIESNKDMKNYTELDQVLFSKAKDLSDEDKMVILNVIDSINKKIDEQDNK